MSFREHLRELRPHGEWKLLEMLAEWLHEKFLGDLGRAALLVAIGAVVQRIRGIPYDLWILALIFLGSLGLLAYSYVRDRRQSRNVSLLGDGAQSQVDIPPLLLSPQDAANGEKIALLFHSSIDQAGGKLQEVMNEMFEQLINQTKDEKGKQDEKILVIAQLAHGSVYISCMNAFSALRRAIDDPNKADLQTLQQLLNEFFRSYQLLVRWMHRLSKFSPRVLHDGNLYTLWKDYHRVFREKLNDLLALEDFQELRENLKGHWDDIF